MAYKMIWRSEDIEFHLLDDLTSDPVVTVEIVTPAGLFLAMAEPEEEGAGFGAPPLSHARDCGCERDWSRQSSAHRGGRDGEDGLP